MIPEAIKKMALKSLIDLMQKEGVKEGRFFINENGSLDMDLAKNGDAFILKSVADEKVNAFKQINSELKEQIKTLQVRYES
jgi:hypothetical protein